VAFRAGVYVRATVPFKGIDGELAGLFTVDILPLAGSAIIAPYATSFRAGVKVTGIPVKGIYGAFSQLSTGITPLKISSNSSRLGLGQEGKKK
jgi:hypothetical protein